MDAYPITDCKTATSQIIWRSSWKPWPCWSQYKVSVCSARSGFFLETLYSSKNDWGQEMNNKRYGLVFSGKGKPQNILGQQVVLKYRITFLHISSLLKYTISIKRHHLHFYINNLLRDLFVKRTASGKMSVNRTDVESCKRLIWRLYSQCISVIHVHSIFKFY